MNKKLTGRDILKYAQQLIREGFKSKGDCLGLHCPWCAIAEAKTQLDDLYKIELPTGEIFRQAFMGDFKELPEDIPLIEARETLKPFINIDRIMLTKKKCLNILNQATAKKA